MQWDVRSKWCSKYRPWAGAKLAGNSGDFFIALRLLLVFVGFVMKLTKKLL
jgi:hypothetical protein